MVRCHAYPALGDREILKVIYQLRILSAVILAVEKKRWPKRKPTIMGSSPVQPWIFAKVAISTTVIALTWSRSVMSRNAGNVCNGGSVG